MLSSAPLTHALSLQALGMDPVFPADVKTSTADSNLTSSNSSQLDGTLDPCTCTSDGWCVPASAGAIGRGWEGGLCVLSAKQVSRHVQGLMM